MGFDRSAVEACCGRQCGAQRISDDDRRELFGLMSSAEGVTELAATFDRRDVLQFVAEWGGDRLNAGGVATLADTWLTLPESCPSSPPSAMPARAMSSAGATGAPWRRWRARLSTPPSTCWLSRARSPAPTSGLATPGHAGGTVDKVLAERAYLGDDQVEMIRSITSSTQRILLVYGPAGSGKTTALEAASRAWEDAGRDVIGAAVQGTASEIVGDKAAVNNATVASIL